MITHYGLFKESDCEYPCNGKLYPGSMVEIFSSESPNILSGTFKDISLPQLQGVMKNCTINRDQVLCFVHNNPFPEYEAEWCFRNKEMIKSFMTKHHIIINDIIELTKGNTTSKKIYDRFYLMFEDIIRHSDTYIC